MINFPVFINKANKFAEIYTVTKTGKIEAAYDKQFKFDGTLYMNDTVKTIKDNAAKKCDYDIMKAFIAGGAEVTVYLDRAKQPVFVMGTQKYAASATETVIATANIDYHNTAKVDYIQVKAFDGKNKNTYDIPIEGLQWISFTDAASNGNKETKYVVDSSKTSDTAYDPTKKEIKTKEFKYDSSTNNVETGSGVDLFAINNSYGKNTVIELTKNDAGKVVGLTFKKNLGNPAADFVGGKTFVKALGQDYQIKPDTTIFAHDGLGNYKKLAYSEYATSTDELKVNVYTASLAAPFDVAYVVVENDSLVSPTTYVKGVIGSILTNDGKATEVVLYQGGTATTYTAFANDTVRKNIVDNAEAGAYISLGIAADGKTVATFEAATKKAGMIETAMSVSSDNIQTGDGTFKDVHGVEYKLAQNYTIVKRVSNLQERPVYEKAEFSELGSLKVNETIYIHKSTTGYVDAIVIQY